MVNMVNMYRENPDDYAKHYNRRSVIGFSAMKRRMQSSIRSRIISFRSYMQGSSLECNIPGSTI